MAPLGRLFGAAALGAVAAVAVADRRNTDQPVRAMFPVAYWGRKLTTELGPLLRQYIVEDDEAERPFNRTTRNWVYASARNKQNTIGFGATYRSDDIGAVVFSPKTFTNEAASMEDKVGTAYHRLIGGRGTPPVMMPTWVYVSGMSYGALSPAAIEALNRGAAANDAWHNTGEGGLSPAHLQGAGVIFQIGTAKYGVRNDDGSLDPAALADVAAREAVKLFEVKLAQGAKPGKGGILPAAKVTPEIAEIRRIPVHQDSMSPPRHAEFSTTAGLFDFLDEIRSITGKPTGIKMVIGDPEEITQIAALMAERPGRGPDFISIDGGDGGTGAAPLVLAAHAGLPMRMALAVADRVLREHEVRDDVTLFASGRIATPQDAAMALAIGADAVGISRANLLALGCIQSLKCHTNTCPTGIATQDQRKMKVLDADAGAARVENYLRTLIQETEMLARSCGYHSPDQLQPKDALVQVEPGRWVTIDTMMATL
jgi:glutamate synthase domain-containing protein 2